MLPGRRIALLLLLECSARARGANGIYGGEADKPHLGGFVDVSVQGGFDRDGLSPRLWRYMLSNWTVHSVIDVGCGRGATSLWFHLQDARVRCVEGSSEAVRQSLLPRSIITQHDFTAGPYIPDETYDMAWSVEFLEHVRSDKMNNYIATLRKAALVVVSASIWGGYHHVEVHPQSWWIRKLETLGFRYSASLTADVKREALEGARDYLPRHHHDHALKRGDPHHNRYRSQHLWANSMIFVNPPVASLPEHMHLFHEPGCFNGALAMKGWEGVECTGSDALPAESKPLPVKAEGQRAWERKVFPSNERLERRAAKAAGGGLA